MYAYAGAAAVTAFLVSRSRAQARRARVSLETLRRQDATTSAAIIGMLGRNARFAALAALEGSSIVKRDAEDAAKLQAGVELSIAAAS